MTEDDIEGITYAAYAPLALRTAKLLETPLDDLRHAALGMITELGELATIVKRIAIYGKPLTPEMSAHAAEEIGDLAWYVPLAMRAIGMQAWHGKFVGQNALEADARRLAVLVGYVAGEAAQDPRALTRQLIAGHCGEIIFLLQHRIGPRLGVDFGRALANNITKLRLRFPEAYSDSAAEARADKGGADARSS